MVIAVQTRNATAKEVDNAAVGFNQAECLFFTENSKIESVNVFETDEESRFFRIVRLLFDKASVQTINDKNFTFSVCVHFQHSKKMYELDFRFVLNDLDFDSLALIDFSEQVIGILTQIVSEKIDSMLLLNQVRLCNEFFNPDKELSPDFSIDLSGDQKTAVIKCFFHQLFSF